MRSNGRHHVLNAGRQKLAALARRAGLAVAIAALAIAAVALAPAASGPAAAAAAPGVTLSGSQFLRGGQPFIPHGFNSLALLNSPWCTTKQTAAAAASYGPAELAAAASTWHADTIRFQISQPVLAGPSGAAYAQQIATGVQTAEAAGFVIILSMQDESNGCGPSEPLPSTETETAWSTLLTDTSLGSDPDVMFELFNEPENTASTAAATSPQQQNWPDWLNGGRQIAPSGSQTWAAYTPVGHQQLVSYLRGTLGTANVLIADGAAEAEQLQGMPILTDPGSGYQIAYAVHPYTYTGGPASWNARFGYLAGQHALIATAWNYPAADCGGPYQAMAPQFLAYMTANGIGMIGQAMDIYSGLLVSGPSLTPTQCGAASPGSGYDFLNDYMNGFAGNGGPTAPSGLTVTAAAAGSISLSWTGSTDPAYAASALTYDVYRGGQLEGTTPAGTTTYTDAGLAPDTSYSYTVTAVDPAGNSSAASSPVTAATSGCPAPAAPTGLAASTSATAISLTWNPVPASGCPVDHYQIQRGGSPLGTSATASYTDSAVSPSTSYTYTVAAVTPDGVTGTAATITATTPAPPDPGPSAPSNLTANPASPTEIDLTWTAAADPVTGIASYQILRNGTVVGTAPASASPAYADTGVAPGTSYTYQVVAVSGGGLTASSPVASAATPAAPVPGAPTALTSTAQSSGSITLRWTAGADPAYGAGQLSYDVYRGSQLAGATAAGVTTFTDSGLTASTSYTYTVTAVDPAGDTSPASAPLTAVTSGCATPAAPVGLQGTAQSAVKVALTWQAVPSAGGSCAVTGYIVLRGGVQIGAPAAAAFTDTGTASNSTYSYQVMTIAGGLTGPAASVSVTTPTVADTTKPTSASHLTATALSPTEVQLSWVAGSDPQSGIRQYTIVRNGTAVATVPPTSLSFTDTSAQAKKTYTYTVVTTDGAGLTATSGGANVTTPAAALSGAGPQLQ